MLVPQSSSTQYHGSPVGACSIWGAHGGGDSLDEGLLGAIPRHQWGLRSLTAASGRDCTYEGQLWSSRAMLETFLQVGCRGVFHNTTTQRQCFLYT